MALFNIHILLRTISSAVYLGMFFTTLVVKPLQLKGLFSLQSRLITINSTYQSSRVLYTMDYVNAHKVSTPYSKGHRLLSTKGTFKT